MTGLSNGTVLHLHREGHERHGHRTGSYTFTVTATNGAGTGPASAPSAPITPSDVPTAPRNVIATAGYGTATVSWTAPLANGGTGITGYTVIASPGGQGCTTPGALSCTVMGLTPGTSYTFAVTATNLVGTGPAGTSNQVTVLAPAAVPGAPTNVTGVIGSNRVTVSWLAPASDGGSPITLLHGHELA